GRLFWVNITPIGGITTGLNGVTIDQVDPNTGGIIGQHVVDQVPDKTFSDDKEFIKPDPRNNKLYVILTRLGAGGDNDAQMLMSYSSDHGVSWSDPVRVDQPGDNLVQGATVAVGSDHRVYAAYHSVTDDAGGQQDVPAHDGKIVVVRLNS